MVLLRRFPGAGFRGAFVSGQGVVPKTIEVRAKRLDARRVQFVNPAIALGAIDHEMRVLQNPEML